MFRAVWKALYIWFNDFIRPAAPRHRIAVSRRAQASRDAGDIYEGVYEGWYCVSCEAFKQEKDLIDGLCPIHRTKPDWIEERNYFFRLSAYRDRLLEHYAKHPEFVVPDSRRNGSLPELKELVTLAGKAQLKPVQVTRRKLQDASAALSDLKAGKVVGRIVLVP